MSRPEPQSCCACIIADSDAAGIRRRILELAREGLPVVLSPEQTRALLATPDVAYLEVEPFDRENSRW